MKELTFKDYVEIFLRKIPKAEKVLRSEVNPKHILHECPLSRMASIIRPIRISSIFPAPG